MTAHNRFFTLLVSVLTILPLVALNGQSEGPRGWHLVNTTATPVGIAWYTTKTERHSIQPSGEAVQNSEPIIIEQGESEFIKAPTHDSENFLQLAVTQSPALLKPNLSSSTSGIDDRLGIFMFDKKTLKLLKKPLLQYLPSNPKLYITQPVGSTQLILIPSPKPLSPEKLCAEGWLLRNAANRPLYAGWYVSTWDSKQHLYREPALGTDQTIFMLEPGENAPMCHPREVRNQKWQLLMSFDNDSLTKTVVYDAAKNLPQRIVSRVKVDLGPYTTRWDIYDQKGSPSLVPHTHLLQFVNTTNNPLYCAMYYVDSSGATKYGPRDYVTEILPQLSCEVPYPPRLWWHTTKLLIAREDQKHLLNEPFLTPNQLTSLHIKDFQKSSFTNWYIEAAFAIEPHRFNPDLLHVSSIGGSLIQRLARLAVDMDSFKGSRIKKYEEAFLRQDPRYMPDPEIIAAMGRPSVLTDPSQRTMEEEFVVRRSEIVRNALNNLFGEEVIPQGAYVPKIAIVFTGGGYRAMIETIGFIEGAASERGGNIFDCCTYVAGLSGSTWAINGLVASGLSPSGFAKHQKHKVGEGGLLPLKTLISNLIEQSATYPEQRFIESRYNKFHGPIGLYGHALTHALLQGFEIEGRDAHTMKLSDLRTNLANAKYPLPLSVAVDPGNSDKERVWYEFSPYYCGTLQEQGSWIDTKLLGCSFYKGRPVHIVPEYPLAQHFGIWGSGFALSPEDIEKASSFGGFLTRSISNISKGFSKAYALLFSEPSDDSLAPGRVTAGTIPNYNYQRPDALEGIASKPLLHFIDAGITMEGQERHNFGTIPALWRNVDMLIMCDCTGFPNGNMHSEYLFAADEEAKRQRLPFPNLTRSTRHVATLKNVDKEITSVFVEENAPIVVYMQAKKNRRYNGYLAGRPGPFMNGFDPDSTVTEFTSYANFSYTPEQYEVLRGLTKSIFIQSKEAIKSAIAKAVERSIN